MLKLPHRHHQFHSRCKTNQPHSNVCDLHGLPYESRLLGDADHYGHPCKCAFYQQQLCSVSWFYGSQLRQSCSRVCYCFHARQSHPNGKPGLCELPRWEQLQHCGNTSSGWRQVQQFRVQPQWHHYRVCELPRWHIDLLWCDTQEHEQLEPAARAYFCGLRELSHQQRTVDTYTAVRGDQWNDHFCECAVQSQRDNFRLYYLSRPQRKQFLRYHQHHRSAPVGLAWANVAHSCAHWFKL